MTYRMLVADLDGTVLNSQNEVTPATVAALRRLDEAGCRVVLATGRSYRTALPVVRAIGLDRPVICLNGGLVKHPSDHRTIDSTVFASDVARRVTETILAQGKSAIVCVDGFTRNLDFVLVPGPHHSPDMQQFLDLYADRYHTTDLDGAAEAFRGCMEIATVAPDAVLQEVRRAVDSQLDFQVRTLIIQAPNLGLKLFEAFAPGVNKWAAALRLADGWKIPADQIAAIGDDVNDLEMIRQAALGMAMANAAECVRQAADRLAPSNDHHGLAEVVDWLLKS